MLKIINTDSKFGKLFTKHKDLLGTMWPIPSAIDAEFTPHQLYSLLWEVSDTNTFASEFSYNSMLLSLWLGICTQQYSLNGLTGDITFRRCTHDDNSNYIKRDYNDYGYEGYVHMIDNKVMGLSQLLQTVFNYNKQYIDSPYKYSTSQELVEIVFALWEGSLVELYIDGHFVSPNIDCTFTYK